MNRSLVLFAALSALAGTGFEPAAAQMGPQWYPLDTAPPGTPPSIVVMSSSTPQQTALQVTIHGFYYETIVRMNQTFRRLSLQRQRDEALYRVVGRPELPTLHHLIGNLVGTNVSAPVVQVLNEITIPGALIYPYQPPLLEDDPPASFQWDQVFYQQTTTPYPAARGASRGYRGRFDGLDLVAAETYPLRVIPAAQTLMVAQRFVVTIAHAGSGSPAMRSVTRRQALHHEILLANYPVVAAFRQPLLNGFAGDYLIVTYPSFVEEIAPLAEQKRQRGYAVTVATTDETGSTCNEIQTYIADWWAAGNPERDHYVLLVGDTWAIPVCASENLTASDLVYACIDGLGDDGLPDVYPEVRLGRFPCDTEDECTDMVTKTLTYEQGYPGSGAWLDDVLLTCHRWADADYPDQYRDAQEAVRTYPYTAVVPAFSTLYGQEGATDAQVRAAVDQGRGVVCYRGHGSTYAWTTWNDAGESFDRTDVGLLANGEKTPVVFAIACQNNDISGVYNPGDAIGERWMVTTQRAVAHFGATQCSSRDANDLLDLELFETIFEDNHAILGEAIAGANLATIISYPRAGEANAWMYLLLGDPELKVWRQPPPPLFVTVDRHEVPVGTGFLTVAVQGQSDGPVEGAIVALYKNGEFTENRYTDAHGIATVPIAPATPGTILLTVHTEFDSYGVANDSIAVVGPGAVEPAAAVPGGRFAVLALGETAGGLALEAQLPRPAARFEARLYDATGRHRAHLETGVLGAGEHQLLLAGARGLPRGVYWIEARARWSGEGASEESARTRWLKR